MKFNKLFVTTVVAVSAVFATQANASVIDTEIATPDKAVNENTTVSFNHDFTDKGFVFGVTQYISGTLLVRLTDSAGGEDGRINYGSQFLATNNIKNNTQNDPTDGTLFTIILNAAALADLNADGILAMSIASTRNAFYFADSTLTLEERQAVVPEPLSISLLAAGMIGFCASRRRSRKS